ncbi:hypothetical protein A2U01_0074249, partial [Trifolium medium]|nr:hypothetical protein [Trifolium medium]
ISACYSFQLPTASVGIRAGFSRSFPNVISHGTSTGDENNCSHQSSVRSDGGVDD